MDLTVVILVLSPFLYNGFTAEISRWSGKMPVYKYNEVITDILRGQLIRDERPFRTFFCYHNLMSFFFQGTYYTFYFRISGWNNFECR